VAHRVHPPPDGPQSLIPDAALYLTISQAHPSKLPAGHDSVLAFGEAADPGVDRVAVTARGCHAWMLTAGESRNKSVLQRIGVP
jgi:hypothetical protein